MRGVRRAGRATVRRLSGRAVLRQGAPESPLDRRAQSCLPSSVRGGRVAGAGPALGGSPGHRGRRGAARGTSAGRRPEGRFAARLSGVLRARRPRRVFGVWLAGVRAAVRGGSRAPRWRMRAYSGPLRPAQAGRQLLRVATQMHAARRPGRTALPVAAVAPR